MSEPQPPKTHDDLAADAVTLGGLLDGAWFLHGEEAREARNAMLPILEAARAMADALARDIEALGIAQRSAVQP